KNKANMYDWRMFTQPVRSVKLNRCTAIEGNHINDILLAKTESGSEVIHGWTGDKIKVLPYDCATLSFSQFYNRVICLDFQSWDFLSYDLTQHKLQSLGNAGYPEVVPKAFFGTNFILP
ncbi:MAG: hypothetical protein MHPSP_002385, partial [Paramarteilia canceri]